MNRVRAKQKTGNLQVKDMLKGWLKRGGGVRSKQSDMLLRLARGFGKSRRFISHRRRKIALDQP